MSSFENLPEKGRPVALHKWSYQITATKKLEILKKYIPAHLRGHFSKKCEM